MKFKILVISFTIFLLAGCKSYYIEETCEKLTNHRLCSLKKVRLKSENTGLFFSKHYTVDIDLIKSKEEHIIVLLKIHGTDPTKAFIPKESIQFFIHTKNREIQKITLLPLWTKAQHLSNPIYTQYGYFYQSPILASSAKLKISIQQIMLIAAAERIEFTFQTHGGKIAGTLTDSELIPFQKFVKECLKNDEMKVKSE